MIRSFINMHNLEYLEDVSLKKYNTYRLNTIARYLIFPRDVLELKELINYLRINKIKYIVLGNGSNVIFKNDVYEGVVINLKYFDNKKVKGDTIVVGAGYSLVKLSMECARHGLAGLEFASGIPGLVGASTAMNAGAYNYSMSDVVTRVKVLTPSLEEKILENKDLEFTYRHSFFKDNRDYIVLEVELKLDKGDREEILEKISSRKERRLLTQPLNYPSAGSVFRNPVNEHAGALIEGCGLKGYVRNGIEVSDKHANFIINKNNGSGKDIVYVIEKISEEVKKKYDVDLILEQEIIE